MLNGDVVPGRPQVATETPTAWMKPQCKPPISLAQVTTQQKGLKPLIHPSNLTAHQIRSKPRPKLTPLPSEPLPVKSKSAGRDESAGSTNHESSLFVGEPSPCHVQLNKLPRLVSDKCKDKWISDQTYQKVLENIKPGNKCAICGLGRTTLRRLKVHGRQHFTHHYCVCGKKSPSRDTIYKHQIHPIRSCDNHNNIIYEVDPSNLSAFWQYMGWPGAPTKDRGCVPCFGSQGERRLLPTRPKGPTIFGRLGIKIPKKRATTPNSTGQQSAISSDMPPTVQEPLQSSLSPPCQVEKPERTGEIPGMEIDMNIPNEPPLEIFADEEFDSDGEFITDSNTNLATIDEEAKQTTQAAEAKESSTLSRREHVDLYAEYIAKALKLEEEAAHYRQLAIEQLKKTL